MRHDGATARAVKAAPETVISVPPLAVAYKGFTADASIGM